MSTNSLQQPKVTGVKYTTGDDTTTTIQILPADVVVVSAGPWSCAVENWFSHHHDTSTSSSSTKPNNNNNKQWKVPMEGIKSTSIVWKQPTITPSTEVNVDGTALFCGENSKYSTHCTYLYHLIKMHRHDCLFLFRSFVSLYDICISQTPLHVVPFMFLLPLLVEVYPRPDGSIYICGIGGSDYISTKELQQGAFRQQCDPNPVRAIAATQAFRDMSTLYTEHGEVQTTQACMRPCPPDGMPYMGPIPGYTGAYINAGHNCWYVYNLDFLFVI